MAKNSFFFSYASQDHQAAWRIDDRTGQRFNLLDRFYDHLCRVVAGKLGLREDAVAYRDKGRLEVGDLWPGSLTDGLQSTETLVALISPHYLQSENCGREFKLILDRFQLLKEKGDRVVAHRILPIYWENTVDIREHRSEQVRRVLDEIQFKTDQAMPENYPATGLRQLMLLSSVAQRELLCEALAKRIADHFRGESMPQIPHAQPFPELPTLFGDNALAKTDAPVVGNGPNCTHVVYVVGEKDEMSNTECPDADRYGRRREDWEPFDDAPGATIEAATKEGIKSLRTDYEDWSWPDELLELMRQARQNNSIVLLVLDRWAICVPSYRETLSEYADTNLPNTGLITAGGTAVDEAEIGEVFDTKYYDEHRHHEWQVVSMRNDYVECVRRIVTGIKADLMKRGRRPVKLTSTRLPGLAVATGGES